MRSIPLQGPKAAGRVALVDDADYDLVMAYKWRLWDRKESGHRVRGPYAVNTVKRGGRTRSIYMHCLIMGFKGVDHANHDGLDNQRHNLRPATKAQNVQNARSRQETTSQYKGVTWHRQCRKWQAAIRISGRSRYLGLHASETAAAAAYDRAARDAYGEFACLNLTPEEDAA
jgi:hypothetical protein